MKKHFKQIFSIICAVYFLMAGLGYNVVNYCCESCENKGITAVLSKSCSIIHHEQYIAESCVYASYQCENTACAEMSRQIGNCSVLRVQTDVPPLVMATASNNFDFGWSLCFPSNVQNFQNKYIFQTEQAVIFPPDKIPLYSGRDILTQKSVLLI